MWNHFKKHWMATSILAIALLNMVGIPVLAHFVPAQSEAHRDMYGFAISTGCLLFSLSVLYLFISVADNKKERVR